MLTNSLCIRLRSKEKKKNFFFSFLPIRHTKKFGIFVAKRKRNLKENSNNKKFLFCRFPSSFFPSSLAQQKKHKKLFCILSKRKRKKKKNTTQKKMSKQKIRRYKTQQQEHIKKNKK